MERKKLKILYVITKSNWGGAQRYVYDLATALPTDVFDVAVALGEEGDLSVKLQEAGVRILSIPGMQRDVSLRKEMLAMYALSKIVKTEKPDILHVNSSKAALFGTFLGRLHCVPNIIFTSHGWAFNERRPIWQKWFIKILQWKTVLFSHITITNSEATRNDMVHLPFMKQKMVTVPLSIEPFSALTKIEARKKLGLNQKAMVIGTISELHDSKGLDCAIEAIAQIPGALFAIIGGGDREEALKKLAQDRKVDDRVQFLGALQDAKKYLGAFDIFTLTSRTESFGLVLLEAGLARLPVVASNVGGIPEIISHGKTGLLVEPGNRAQIVNALTELIQDEQKRNRLGSALKDHVQKNFSIEQMLEKTFGLYRLHS